MSGFDEGSGGVAKGQVEIFLAPDRVDGTHGLLIALGSLAEPFLDTTSDFAEIIFAFSALPQSWSAAAFWSAPRAGEPTPKPTASNSAGSRSSPRTSKERPASASKRARRSAALRAATTSVRVRFRV
jgi:hypothetical protein